LLSVVFLAGDVAVGLVLGAVDAACFSARDRAVFAGPVLHLVDVTLLLPEAVGFVPCELAFVDAVANALLLLSFAPPPERGGSGRKCEGKGDQGLHGILQSRRTPDRNGVAGARWSVALVVRPGSSGRPVTSPTAKVRAVRCSQAPAE